jgi:hypothetical protein
VADIAGFEDVTDWDNREDDAGIAVGLGEVDSSSSSCSVLEAGVGSEVEGLASVAETKTVGVKVDNTVGDLGVDEGVCVEDDVDDGDDAGVENT